jgi:hypothetical protein
LGLGGTVTLTKVNDTDTFVVYDINPATTTGIVGNVFTLGLDLSTFGNPDLATNGTLVSATDSVCVSFDLFRRKNVVSPNTPTGGVVVATDDADQPKAVGSIVVTADTITLTGVTYNQTKTESNITATNTSFVSVPQANGNGMMIDYVVRKTNSSTATRTGQIYAAWDGLTSTVEFTDTSTREAGTGTTAGLAMRVIADGTDAKLGFTVTSDTYTLTVYVRVLGTYS